MQINHYQTIKCIAKFGIHVKGNHFTIESEVLPKQYWDTPAIRFQIAYQRGKQA